jgi:hypothetical protein
MSDGPKFVDIDGDSANPFGLPPRYNYTPLEDALPDDDLVLRHRGVISRNPEPKLARLLKLLVSALTAPVPFSVTVDGPPLTKALEEFLAGEEVRPC